MTTRYFPSVARELSDFAVGKRRRQIREQYADHDDAAFAAVVGTVALAHPDWDMTQVLAHIEPHGDHDPVTTETRIRRMSATYGNEGLYCLMDQLGDY